MALWNGSSEPWLGSSEHAETFEVPPDPEDRVHIGARLLLWDHSVPQALEIWASVG